jgi:superfamily II DNA or RNA helicase
MKTLFDEIAEPVHLTPHTKFSPRDYQQAGIDRAFELWKEGHIGVLFRQPTGTGKTVSGTMIADLWNRQGPEYRTLILAHERQLIQQFAQEVEDILEYRPAIEMGDLHCRGDEKIVVGSRQTLYVRGEGFDAVSRLYKFDPKHNWLLVIDEAHRWRKGLASCTHIINWFEQNQNHRRLGLTATPERSDKVSLKTLFPGVASDYRLFDVDGGACAVNDGWAVPYDQRFITVDGVDFKNIREVAKDFDKNELERILGESETLAKLCDPLLEIVGRRRTIIFSPGTAMARDVALYLNSKLEYEAAVSVDGSYPDIERQAIYKRHQRGDVQFLSVCGLCREGYNDPGIQCVAVFRPTKSRSLKEQMLGRGCRPLRGVVSSEMTPEERRRSIRDSDKPNCLVIDLVGITGLGDVPSTASLMAEGKPDEVIERANRAMLAKPTDEASDVAAEIRKAEAEISEERRLKREEELRKQQKEMDRRAKFKAEVRYSEHQVQSGGGGAHRGGIGTQIGNATEGQVRYLIKLGVPVYVARAYGKKEASREIGRMLKQQKEAGSVPPQAPCTEQQANVMRKFGLPTDISYAQAASYIRQINSKEITRNN